MRSIARRILLHGWRALSGAARSLRRRRALQLAVVRVAHRVDGGERGAAPASLRRDTWRTSSAMAMTAVRAVMSPVMAVAAATNPATLSMRGWFTLVTMATIVYLRRVSTLSRRPNDTPCPDHGVILRVLYGFFHTRLAEMVRATPSHSRPRIHATSPHRPSRAPRRAVADPCCGGAASRLHAAHEGE